MSDEAPQRSPRDGDTPADDGIDAPDPGTSDHDISSQFDLNITASLRATPDDLDELFARRAISAALEVEDRPGSRRASGRRSAGLMGAAAAIVAIVAISVVAVRASSDGSSFATGGAADSAQSEARTMTEGANADTSYDGSESHEGAADDVINDAIAPGEAGISGDNQGSAIQSESADGLVYLGEFVDTGSLVTELDVAEGSGVDVQKGEAGPPADETSRQMASTCAEALRVRGYEPLGWAIVDGLPVTAAREPSLGLVEVFDAGTCTA